VVLPTPLGPVSPTTDPGMILPFNGPDTGLPVWYPNARLRDSGKKAGGGANSRSAYPVSLTLERNNREQTTTRCGRLAAPLRAAH
jgi:hypothetical protein